MAAAEWASYHSGDKLFSPGEVHLYQNHPNPFNPNTTIQFDIVHDGLVRLSIYNLHGQLVRRLVADIEPPGRYTIPFNAEGLSSGTYFYELEANTGTEARKLVILK